MTKLTIDDAKIAETAYLLWLDEGQPCGRDQEHWLKAIDALTPPKAKKARKAATPKPRAAKSATKVTAKPKAAAKPKAKAKAKAASK